MQPTVISLFAGIGGFDLGFQRAGFRIAAHVEKDANCRKLLAAKWPDAVSLDDVRTAGKHNLPTCDVVVGGSPCQSFSVAGLRKGLNDPRGNLLLEYLRVVSELRPAWMVWENVPGVLSDKTKALYSFLDALEEISYVVIGLDILDAQFHGVAQRRRRIFVCAQSIESLRSQKTATSVSIFLQCLTEIFQSTLAVLKGQLTPDAGSSDLPSGRFVHSVQRRMKLFGLLTEEQASLWLNNLAALQLSFDSGQDASESNHGSTSRQDVTTGKDTNCGMESEMVTESASGALQSIGASWRNTLEEGLSAARLCITSTAPSETIESRIFMCAQACLTTARFTQAYLTSSPNYWKTATSSLTALKEYIEYARQTSSDLFGDVGRVREWNAFIREAERLCSAFEHTRIECFGSLFPLEKGVFWHPAPSREAGQGVAGCLESRTDGGGFPGTDGACAGHVVPAVAKCLGASPTATGHLDPSQQTFIPSVGSALCGNSGGNQVESDYIPAVPVAQVNTMQVRRLTPRECSRLQGFPDDWLDGFGFSDSTKYKMLGNAVCVNVAAWIAGMMTNTILGILNAGK